MPSIHETAKFGQASQHNPSGRIDRRHFTGLVLTSRLALGVRRVHQQSGRAVLIGVLTKIVFCQLQEQGELVEDAIFRDALGRVRRRT